jgi:shikimate kinase
MAAGKTTVGRLLARRLHYRFVDLDDVIEEREGASVEAIFETRGEEGFRRAEARALAEVSEKDDIVLAAGGGVVERPENRSLLREKWWVVFLDVPFETALERIQESPQIRPLARHGAGYLRELFERRASLYREVASHVIDVGDKKPEVVVSEIEAALAGKRHG